MPFRQARTIAELEKRGSCGALEGWTARGVKGYLSAHSDARSIPDPRVRTRSFVRLHAPVQAAHVQQ